MVDEDMNPTPRNTIRNELVHVTSSHAVTYGGFMRSVYLKAIGVTFLGSSGSPAPRLAHFTSLALRRSRRSVEPQVILNAWRLCLSPPTRAPEA